MISHTVCVCVGVCSCAQCHTDASAWPDRGLAVGSVVLPHVNIFDSTWATQWHVRCLGVQTVLKAKVPRDKGPSLKVQMAGISWGQKQTCWSAAEVLFLGPYRTPQCHLSFRRHLELQRQENHAGSKRTHHRSPRRRMIPCGMVQSVDIP